MIQWQNFSMVKTGVIAPLTFIFIVIDFIFIIIICVSKFPLQYLKWMMTDTTGKLKKGILTIRMWKKKNRSQVQKTSHITSFFLLS